MSNRKFGFNTRAIHAGTTPDPTTGASVTPIYQTSSFVFKSTDHAKSLFGLEEEGYVYSRIGNPTVDAFERRIADLEGGVGAVAASSGMAAEIMAMLNLARAGDEIVSSPFLYGGTNSLFTYTLPNLGITTRFVDPHKPEEIRAAINEKTRALYVETLGNPRLNVPDIRAMADVAHGAGIPLVIDSTFATPYLCRPIEHGADVVVHSTTKWIGGHGNSIGGVVVDGGRFDWKGSGRFPHLTEPEPAYHGVSFTGTFGEAAFIARLRTLALRDVGACMAPFNAFLFLQGLETLPLRMRQHCENARRIAEHLDSHPRVEWLLYPGLPSHPDHGNAARYFENGFGSMIGFGVKGGRDASERFINALQLVTHLANIGDTKSLAIHPATTTHYQLTAEELLRAGITDDFIRFSVGLEDAEDIMWDIDQALDKSVK